MLRFIKFILAILSLLLLLFLINTSFFSNSKTEVDKFSFLSEIEKYDESREFILTKT
jgi:uncharacterized protein YxeA